MSDQHLGNFSVSGQSKAKRFHDSVNAETISADRAIVPLDYAWLALTPNASGLKAVLPDATGLENGWSIIISNESSTQPLTINSNGGALLKSIAATVGADDTKMYKVMLLSNSTSAGNWKVIELGDLTFSAQASYIANFASTDFPNAVSGFRTLTKTQTSGLGVATHGKGANPSFIIQRKDGSDFRNVSLHDLSKANGDLELKVLDGDQFDGRVIFNS